MNKSLRAQKGLICDLDWYDLNLCNSCPTFSNHLLMTTHMIRVLHCMAYVLPTIANVGNENSNKITKKVNSFKNHQSFTFCYMLCITADEWLDRAESSARAALYLCEHVRNQYKVPLMSEVIIERELLAIRMKQDNPNIDDILQRYKGKKNKNHLHLNWTFSVLMVSDHNGQAWTGKI